MNPLQSWAAPVLDLAKLGFTFQAKPLLIGGMAMEYYGLRKTGRDIDLVVVAADRERLAVQYPDHQKDLYGDLGVCIYEFEIWQTICLFDYAFLAQGAIEYEDCLVISLEKLLFLKALAMKEPKYHRDLELIVERVLRDQYDRVTTDE
ncbi:MAG: hypothetical protein JW910_18225 [Anaerolineae bacterium]|nr:hypothetical protein [Anaerolineae bacterium]